MAMLGLSPKTTRLSGRTCTVATEPITVVVAGKGDFVFFGECTMRNLWPVLGIFTASLAVNAASLSSIKFINSGGDAVVAISLAAPGSNDWKPVKFRGVTGGGYINGGYMGKALADIDTSRGCVYDVLVEFATRKALLIDKFDVCRMHHLDINKAWQRADSAA